MQIEQTGVYNDRNHRAAEGQTGILAYMKEEQAGPRVATGEQYKKAEGFSGAVDMSDATYMRPEQTKEKKSIAEQVAGDGEMTAEARRNEMAVLANTTSAEDLARMEEDGFTVSDMQGSTIVTVTDKIKVALVKGGADVSFGDDLSAEEIAQVTGSGALAAQIAQNLSENDLPATEENISDATLAYEQAQAIGPLDDAAIRYLVKNELAPTIENIYRAEHSYVGTSDASGAKTVSDEEFEQIREQVDFIIQNAGCEVTQETEADARYLLENNILLTEKNLAYFEDLKQAAAMEFSDEKLLSAMSAAVSGGKRPLDGVLLDGYSLWEQADTAVSVLSEATDEDLEYLLSEGRELTVSNLKTAAENRGSGRSYEDKAALLTARRKLEEARLAMTAEANYALLKKGIAIDTKPLAELVDCLKQQEENYYKRLFSDFEIEPTKEHVEQFATTEAMLSDLKSAPAEILSFDVGGQTIPALHEAGALTRADYEKANERYEALWTAPRADMGDSVAKAFRNVDDILTDLGLERTDANRRAVRILAYNQTEITTANIARMKGADEEVQRLFANMTPRVTLEMIRKGINPLDMSVSELNRAAEEIRSEFTESDNERFEKFLWKLEQNKEISEEERSSYIGIYRLIAQVEKTDGAVIGSLLNQDAGLTMRNLLTAVRTNRKGSMEYEVNDNFDGVEAKITGARIDDQIMAAYQVNCAKDAAKELTPQAAAQIAERFEEMTPEQVKEAVYAANEEAAAEEAAEEAAYQNSRLEEYAQVLSASEDIYAYLEQNDIPNTVNNILAVTQMFRNPNKLFERLFTPHDNTNENIEAVRQMKELVLERFSEAIKSPGEMAEAQEALADIAEHVMDTMIIENDHVSAVDLKELRLLNKQLSLCAKQSKQECYMIPVATGDGVTGVSLKVFRGEEKKGLVDILFRGSLMGKVAASLEAKEDGISGVIATDDEQTRQLFSDNLGMLAEALSGGEGESVDLRVAYIPDLSLEHYAAESSANRRQQSADNEKNPVQTARLYRMAEGFIQTLAEFDTI